MTYIYRESAPTHKLSRLEKVLLSPTALVERAAFLHNRPVRRLNKSPKSLVFYSNIEINIDIQKSEKLVNIHIPKDLDEKIICLSSILFFLEDNNLKSAECVCKSWKLSSYLLKNGFQTAHPSSPTKLNVDKPQTPQKSCESDFSESEDDVDLGYCQLFQIDL